MSDGSSRRQQQDIDSAVTVGGWVEAIGVIVLIASVVAAIVAWVNVGFGVGVAALLGGLVSGFTLLGLASLTKMAALIAHQGVREDAS